ncbi:hypothetical protein KM043_003201 [Ampulex compressa]|nr:hypothetical protein KM043_003201 [Ampulex compressa]
MPRCPPGTRQRAVPAAGCGVEDLWKLAQEKPRGLGRRGALRAKIVAGRTEEGDKNPTMLLRTDSRSSSVASARENTRYFCRM